MHVVLELVQQGVELAHLKKICFPMVTVMGWPGDLTMLSRNQPEVTSRRLA